MIIDQLVSEIARRGISLRSDGAELVVSSNRGNLDPEFLARLKAHKGELLSLLEQGAPSLLAPNAFPLTSLTREEIDRIASRAPGGAANIQDIYPLAPLQEGILFHHLLDREDDLYILRAMLRFDSHDRLRQAIAALQAVVNRHDILRTSFVWEGLREPVQVVWRRAELSAEEVALDDSGRAAAEQLSARFDPAVFRMDVSEAPLLRLRYTRDTRDGSWMALILLHHLIGDHVTLDVIEEEVRAYVLGRADSLPKPIPFRNLVAQARSGAGQEEHERFFRKLLADVDETTAPFGVPDGARDAKDAEEDALDADAGLALRLQSCARRLGVTAASLLHVAWALVLARATGREDVVFGTVLFGRMGTGVGDHRALGLFINTLPIRIRTGDAGAEETVIEAHRLVGELTAHEHASLTLAQRCSSVMAPAPLFTSILNFRRASGAAAQSPGSASAWEGIQIVGGDRRNNYPVTVIADDFGNGLRISAQAVKSIGARRVCELTLAALAALVEALETRPSAPLRSLEFLPPAEWKSSPAREGERRADHRHREMKSLIEDGATAGPDRVAVVFGEEQVTFAALHSRANRLARRLREAGVGPEVPVAIHLGRSALLPVAVLAVLKAGGAYVPLEDQYPAAYLSRQIELARIPIVLTETAVSRTLPAGLFQIVEADREDPMDGSPHDPPETEIDPRQAAYILFTSGSTGAPKGVVVEHRQIANYVQSIAERIPLAGLAHAYVSTFAADLGNTTFFPSLCFGGTLHIASYALMRDGKALAEYCSTHQIGGMKIVPSHLRGLLDRGCPVEQLLPREVLVLGGEASDAAWLSELHGARPELAIWNHYGPTETAVGVSAGRIAFNGSRVDVSIGRPIANVALHVLDSDMRPLAFGAPGELYVGGDAVTRGYLDPTATASRYLPDPYAENPGARLYRTGDRVRWRKSGELEFLGRIDDQVKLRGYRIEPGEIVSALRRQQGVRDACVIVREDAPGEPRLVAYLILEPEIRADFQTIRTNLRNLLPEHMIPAAYDLLERIPVTPNGKLDRRALPAPRGETKPTEAARDNLELILQQVWKDVLKTDHVGLHDSFFDLGGHSMAAVDLISRLITELGTELPIRVVFVHPTVASMAQYLRSGEQLTWSSLVAINRSGSKRPLFCFHTRGGLVLSYTGLAQALGPDQPVYGLQDVSELSSPVRTIPELAKGYVRALRAVQSHGPFQLAGYSLGGTFAWEAAHQLEASGERVGTVFLLDAGPTAEIEGPGLEERVESELLKLTRRRLSQELDTHSAEQAGSLPVAEQLDLLLHRDKQNGRTPDDVTSSQFYNLYLRSARHVAAKTLYEMPELRAPVVLLQSAQSESVHEDAPVNPIEFLSARTHGGLRVHTIPDSLHQSLLTKPYVNEIAREIQKEYGDRN
jgi:amino acid adenylation domain-containing protein